METKLEWLTDNMPDGWSMHEEVVTNGGNWIIDCGDNRWTFNDYSGDIGLAPLTALMKLELRVYCIDHAGPEHVVTTQMENGRWVKQYSRYMEFEAVFNAYKEMREAKGLTEPPKEVTYNYE